MSKTTISKLTKKLQVDTHSFIHSQRIWLPTVLGLFRLYGTSFEGFPVANYFCVIIAILLQLFGIHCSLCSPGLGHDRALSCFLYSHFLRGIMVYFCGSPNSASHWCMSQCMGKPHSKVKCIAIGKNATHKILLFSCLSPYSTNALFSNAALNTTIQPKCPKSKLIHFSNKCTES